MAARVIDIVRRVAGEFHVAIETPDILFSDNASANRNSGGMGTVDNEIAGSHKIVATVNDDGTVAAAHSLIRVSLSMSADPERTSFHESFHSLQAMGAITSREQALMRSEAPRLRAMLRGRERDMGNGWSADRLIQKEVEAYAFDTYAMAALNGDPNPGSHLHIGVRRLFHRLLATLYRIRNFFAGHGYQTTEDVFGRAYRGEIAARRGNRDWRAMAQSGAPTYSFSPRVKADVERMNAAAGLPASAKRPSGATFETPQVSATKRMRLKLQDEFATLEQIQEVIEKERGEPLPGSLDAYVAQTLFSGRSTERIDDFRTEQVKPLVEGMRAARVSPDDLGLFLYARHAPERNAMMAERDPGRFGEDGGSGMSNETAEAILQGFRDDGRYDALDALAGRVDAMIAFDRKNRLDAGLIDEETLKGWEDAYEHYVPLRGFAEQSDDSADTTGARSARPRVGRGFDIRGPEAKNALGRQSLSANPLHFAIMQVEEGITRAEKNRSR